MIWSAWLNKAAIVLEENPALRQGDLPDPRFLIERSIVDDRTINGILLSADETEIDRLGRAWSPAAGPNTSAQQTQKIMGAGFDEIVRWFEGPAANQSRLEGAFRATLDAAMYRVDPWFVGVVWRRWRISPPRLIFVWGSTGGLKVQLSESPAQPRGLAPCSVATAGPHRGHLARQVPLEPACCRRP